jgi:hypothetical protein
MRLAGDGGILKNHRLAECVVGFLDRHARWCTYRDIPVINIWVREFCRHHQEYFHLGYHMPTKHDANYATQLALWLDEAIGLHNGDPATIATSELGSSQVDGCVKGGSSGYHIAAYLGKSEPNTYRTAWGKEHRNDQKKRRNQTGGEGPIEGTAKHY